MGIESHVGYAKNAFLGEKKGNLAYRAKVDEAAEGINKILNPIDDVAKKMTSRDSVALIHSFGIQVDSVESLDNTIHDPNKSQQQKENAEIVLDVLAKGAYIAMRYGENEEVKADLCSGSVERIESRLPEPLKGLGERVRANIIDEPDILRILDELDKQRERHEKNGALGRKTLAKKIEEAYEELDTLEIESKYEDQRGMVMAFLGVEAEELDVNAGVRVSGGRRGQEVPSSYFAQQGKDVDSSQTGAQLDTYRALSELGGLEGTSHEEIAKWVFKVTDQLTRGSLFWAGSAWQQIGPYLERQIETAFAGDKGKDVETRKANERMFMQAVVACRMQEQAIIHCDGDPSSYSELLPPPGKMTDYLWKDGTVKLVEGGVDGGERGVVGEIRRYIRQMAYNKEGGLVVARGLKNPNEINILAEKIANDIVNGNVSYKDKDGKDTEVKFNENDLDYGKEMARVGIALFIVEDYARWAMWSCKKSLEPNGLDEVPWMVASKKDAGAPNESGVWTERVTDNSGRKDWVEVWGSNFPGTDNATCVQHPYCQFMRPVDLYRYKSSWNEDILGPLEDTLKDLAIRKWMYKDDGTKDPSAHIENMLRPSLMSPKDFNRWNAMVSAWIGGTQADGLDNFKDWLKGAEQLKALLQTRADALDLGGEIAGDVFYHKTRAFMSMQSSDFLKALSIALGGDIYEVKEIQAYRGDLLGSTGIGEFGQLFESIKRINLHMGTKRFNQAMAMLQTGVNDPERAEKLLKVKKVAIVGQGILGTLGGMAGQKKR